MEASTPSSRSGPNAGAGGLPLRTLLYRYFFFNWLFKHPASSDPFERALVVQYNRRQARWLPTYMQRWAWWGLLFYALGGFTELLWEAQGGARWFYAASAMCLSFIVTMATAWVHLRHRNS